MNVKPNSAGTPHALLRSAVTPNSAPIITPNISSGAMMGAAANRLCEIHLHARPCTGNRRKHRQRQQPVRVPQYAVLALG